MSILEINDLSFTYDGGTAPIFDHVSFRLDTDWRLGFTGRNVPRYEQKTLSIT